MTKRIAFTRGEKGMLISVTLFVAIVAALALWQQEINTNPTLTIPTPVMPIANARDAYLKACDALTSLQIQTAAAPQSLSLDDVETLLENEGTLDAGKGIAAFYAKPHDLNVRAEPSLAEVRALLQANAPALAALRKGFGCEYREIPLRSFSTLLPHYAKFREIARCLHFVALIKRRDGDVNGAVNDALDGIGFGEDIPHGAPLIGMLVGIAIQAIDRRDIWQGIDHLNAAQARAAARRMEDILSRHAPIAEVMQEEKWSQQAGLLEIFHKPNWRNELSRIVGISQVDGSLAALSSFRFSKRQILDEISRYDDVMIANARLPYAVCKCEPPLPKDPFAAALAPVLAKACFKDTINETQNGLLITSFALHAFYLEHGHYPAMLSQLYPSYLKAIPTDPFAVNGPFRYRCAGKGYILYSVGPDGKDDGGSPCAGGRVLPIPPLKGVRPPQYQPIDPSSTGDIVAGVNMY